MAFLFQHLYNAYKCILDWMPAGDYDLLQPLLARFLNWIEETRTANNKIKKLL